MKNRFNGGIFGEITSILISGTSGVFDPTAQRHYRKQGNWPEVPPPFGYASDGGYYVGSMTIGGTAYKLIVAPKSSGQSNGLQWKTSLSLTSGTRSDYNGAANTAAMISAGAAAHPAADFCNNLSIGGYSDWYLPARKELMLAFWHLRPTATTNVASPPIAAEWYYSTIPNAIPPKTSNWGGAVPGQTEANDFKTGNSEAFDSTAYWGSTENYHYRPDRNAFSLDMNRAFMNDSAKTDSYRYVRAFRRVAL